MVSNIRRATGEAFLELQSAQMSHTWIERRLLLNLVLYTLTSFNTSLTQANPGMPLSVGVKCICIRKYIPAIHNQGGSEAHYRTTAYNYRHLRFPIRTRQFDVIIDTRHPWRQGHPGPRFQCSQDTGNIEQETRGCDNTLHIYD